MLAKRWHENCNVSLTQPNKSSKKENIYICTYVRACVRVYIEGISTGTRFADCPSWPSDRLQHGCLIPRSNPRFHVRG